MQNIRKLFVHGFLCKAIETNRQSYIIVLIVCNVLGLKFEY